jgi:multiple antibiotic resistance protein
METLKSLVTILIPLLIIMDPLGNLPLFLLFTKQNTPKEQNRMAAIASGSACIILIFFCLTGDFILRFFGIGLPSFQIAGGLIFFIYSLQMLHLFPIGIKSTTAEEEEGVTKDNVALVPLATPLLAGPGAITAVLVWQESFENPISIVVLVGAVIIACLMVYSVFYFGKWIQSVLGVGGIRVVTRIMGLFLAVVAVQFVVSGFQQLR